MSIQLVIIVGIIVAYVAASVAEGMVLNGAATLPPDVRERVFRREAALGAIWRIVGGLGLALVVIGLLKTFGFIRGGPKIPWGLYTFAGGFALICLERTLRSWGTFGSYAKEDPQGPARAAALNAALLVTLVELALGVGVVWYIKDKAVGPGGGSSASTASGETEPDEAEAEGSTGGGPAPKPEKIAIWIPAPQAKALIGKDDAYFDLLVRWGQVRKKETGGELFYQAQDLKSLKQAGLPAVQEMEEGLKRMQAAPPEPPAEAVKSPEGERLEE